MSLQVACGHLQGPTPIAGRMAGPADYAPSLRSPWRAANDRLFLYKNLLGSGCYTENCGTLAPATANPDSDFTYSYLLRRVAYDATLSCDRISPTAGCEGIGLDAGQILLPILCAHILSSSVQAVATVRYRISQLRNFTVLIAATLAKLPMSRPPNDSQEQNARPPRI